MRLSAKAAPELTKNHVFSKVGEAKCWFYIVFSKVRQAKCSFYDVFSKVRETNMQVYGMLLEAAWPDTQNLHFTSCF